MAKPLIHVGLAVSTVGTGQDGLPNNGIHPQYSSIINIAGAIGEAYTFNQNVLPEGGRYGHSTFWEKHPEEFQRLLTGARPLNEVVGELRGWLRQFQGRLLACTSAVDFWHLMSAFFKVGKDFPFGSNGLIDTASVQMLRLRRRSPQRVSTEVTPLAVAKARWEVVTQGEMPRFGETAQRGKKKSIRDAGITQMEYDPMRVPLHRTIHADDVIRRLREQELAIQADQERRRRNEEAIRVDLTHHARTLFAPRAGDEVVYATGNMTTTDPPLVEWVVNPYDDGNMEDEREVEAVEEETF